MGIEHVDDLGEVGERAGQTIHFVDHDHLDSPGLNIGQHALQRRAAPKWRRITRRRHTCPAAPPSPHASDYG
jgi:hypothetical protein